jgi:hypothetical protein
MPTITFSIPASFTPTDTPTPSASPYVGLRMAVSADVDSKSNFRLQGLRSWSPGEPIDVSSRGFSTRYVVNGTTGLLSRLERGEVGGLSIETRVNTTGSVAVVQFFVVSELETAMNISLCLGSDIFVDKNRHSQISKRVNGTGFQIVSGLAHFQVFAQKYPMVVDADSYWFGPSVSFDTYQWSQVSQPEIESDDLSFAVAWVNREVPARGRLVLSALMSWGDDLTPPSGTLDLEPPDEGDMIEWNSPVTWTGKVEGAVSVLLIIDGTPVEVTQPAGGSFSITCLPSALRLSAGSHTFVIVAVDASGAMSTISEFKTQVKAPTPVATQTFACTRSPTASATLSATWGEAADVPWFELPDNQAQADVDAPAIVIGVGIPVGAILIVGFSILLWRYRRAAREDMNQRLRTGSSSQGQPSGIDF